MTNTISVAVIGLGRLGLPMAAVLAAKGFRVVGADIDEERVRAVNAGTAPFYEPGLQAAMDKAGDRLRATTDTAAAVEGAGVILVLVGSPLDERGRFSAGPAVRVCREIGESLDDGALVLVRTTLMPGTTGGEVRDALLAGGGAFGLAYSPEFLALGTVIRDFANPAFVLVGAEDAGSHREAERFYRCFVENEPAFVHTNLVNAEVAKLASNVGRMLKLTYGNLLARICEGLPDANCDEVAALLAADPVIGPGYVRGGLGYGGTCFPRDEQAIVALCEGTGVDSSLPLAMALVNDDERERLMNRVLEMAREGEALDRREGEAVAVLGLSFKMGTPVTEGSTGYWLWEELPGYGVEVVAWDPLVAVPESVQSPQGAVDRADVVVLCHPDPEFRELAFRAGQVVIDPWRVLPGAVPARHVPLGVGPKLDDLRF